MRVNYMTWDRWYDSSWVRWHKMLPEKQGGWAFQQLVDPNGNNILYDGLARGLIDWSSLDGTNWIAIGTHQKLYLVQPGSVNTLYDITPVRYVSNPLTPYSTQFDSSVVTVTDPNNGAQDGSFIEIQGGVPVASLTIQGSYQISFIDLDTYAITVEGSADATTTGGHVPSISYEITPGLPSNGELYGYGTYLYSAFEYGTARPTGDGVFARLRSWSLDNYGEDLIASYSDGEIYWWQRPYGPNQPAQLLSVDAPTNCQRVIVDVSQRVIVALGCTDITSAYDALLVRWCDLDDIQTWIPSVTNLAGDYSLSIGSRIITGIRSKGQNLIWTDKHLYRMVLTGGTGVYSFYGAGTTQIVGPNAAIDVDGVGYWLGFDNFYNYSGTINILPCEVWESVFGPQNATSIDRTQTEKTFVFSLESKSEITWLYQSISSSGDVDRYVTYNWDDQVWYYGAWNRTACQGQSPAIGGGYPYGVNAGLLYQHETGTDAIEPGGTFPIGWYMESLDITTGGAKSEYTMGGSDARFAIGGSQAHLRVLSMVPDFAAGGGYMNGSMNITLKTKDRPQQPSYQINGPVTFDSSAEQVDIDAHGSQIRIRLDNYNAPGTPDPDFANVTLLMHFDGGEGSFNFIDNSSFGNECNSVTGGGSIVTPGGGQQSTDEVLYGVSSFISQTNPAVSMGEAFENVQIPVAAGSPQDLTRQASWTIEFSVFPLALSQPGLFHFDNGTDNSEPSPGIQIATTLSGQIIAAGNRGSGYPTVQTSNVMTLNAWNTVCVEVIGGNMTVYLNGVQGQSSAVVDPYQPPLDGSLDYAFYVGCGINGVGVASTIYAYIDELRISNIARYQGNYTPATQPFPNGSTQQPSLGSSFRMGIWQALAFPYAKR